METIKVIDKLKIKLVSYLNSHDIDIEKGNVPCLYKQNHLQKSDNKPSMGLLPSHDATHCFTCGAVADIFHWAHKIEGLPIGADPKFYTVTVPKLAKDLLGITYIPPAMSETEQKKQIIQRVYKSVLESIQMSNDDVNDYITKDRGWDDTIRNKYKLGSVTSFENYVSFMIKSGYPVDILKEAGVYRDDIFNHNRLIIPVFDAHSNPIRFTARIIIKDTEQVKYLHTSSNILNQNIPLLFGLNNVIGKNTVYVVEGPTDVISMFHYGYENTVAIMGSKFSADHISILRKNGVKNFSILLDGDMKWKPHFDKHIVEIIQKTNINMSIILLPDNKDPDDYVKDNNKISSLSVLNPIEYLLSTSDTEGLTTEAQLDTFTTIISVSQNVISRDKMIKDLAKATNVSEELIRRDVINKVKVNKDISFREQHIAKQEIKKVIFQNESTIEDIYFEVKRKYENLKTTLEVDVIEYAFQMLSDTKEFIDNAKNEPSMFFGDMIDLQTKTDGLDRHDNIILVAGKPHAGKSSWVRYLFYQIANSNDDMIAIYFSMEDDRLKVITTMLSIINGKSRNLNKKRVRMKDQGYLDDYNKAWEKLNSLTTAGRLMIFDRSIGRSIETIHEVISSIKMAMPEKNIIIAIDSINALSSGRSDSKDPNESMIQMIDGIKDITNRFDIPAFVVVELRKNDNKPISMLTLEDLRNTYKLGYISDIVMFLGEKTTGRDMSPIKYPYDDELHPIIELYIRKNKINGYCGKFSYIFKSHSSQFIELSDEDTI